MNQVITKLISPPSKTMIEQPSFSIIIPTFNRPDRLDKCLRALAIIEYPCDQFEVIVVDDGSPESLSLVIAPYKEKINIRLIVQPNTGPAGARNRGAKEANGDFLAFTDDDCQPASNWLSILASQFFHTPDAMIGGLSINALSNNLYSEASQLLIDYLYTYYNTKFSDASFFTSNNLAVSKHGFHKIGGFDTNFLIAAGEDRELCDRWKNSGFQFVYLPKAIVNHGHLLNFRAFFCQHFNYGRGAFRYRQMLAERNHSRIQLEPKNFYLDLLRYPSSCGAKNAFSLSLLIFVSQFANALGFFREAFRYKFLRKPLRMKA